MFVPQTYSEGVGRNLQLNQQKVLKHVSQNWDCIIMYVYTVLYFFCNLLRFSLMIR